MAKNYRHSHACDTLAVAIAEIKHNGVAEIKDKDVLLLAFHALLNEPQPCADDCKWAGHPQKCRCCARNYKRMKDCYERT